MDEMAIPMVVDSLKDLEDFPLTRCIYYAAEVDEAATETGEPIDLKGLGVPLLMLGFAGIIYRPVGDQTRFSSAEAIEQTFDRIEADPRLYVRTRSIWLANTLLLVKGPPAEQCRGAVFRIGRGLYFRALQFARGTVTREQFVATAEDYASQVEHSPQETDAFARWAEMQVDKARNAYHAEPEMALPYSDDRDLSGFQKGDES